MKRREFVTGAIATVLGSQAVAMAGGQEYYELFTKDSWYREMPTPRSAYVLWHALFYQHGYIPVSEQMDSHPGAIGTVVELMAISDNFRAKPEFNVPITGGDQLIHGVEPIATGWTKDDSIVWEPLDQASEYYRNNALDTLRNSIWGIDTNFTQCFGVYFQLVKRPGWDTWLETEYLEIVDESNCRA